MLLTPLPETAIAGAVFVALLTTVTVELKPPVLFGAKTMCMTVLCPGANVAPLMPLVTLKAVEPVMLTPEIVTLEFPVFVNVTGSVVLSPTVSFPKLNCDVDETRLLVEVELLPLSETVSSTALALFFSVKVPLNVPEVVGLNPTAKYVVAPGASEKGTDSELILNTALLIEALETVTLDVVTFLMASVCVSLFPIGTDPNDTDDGVDVREADGLVVEVELLPLSETVSSTALALFFSVKVPLNVPEVVGLNPTAKYVVAPGASEKGSASELILKTELLIVALVTVRLAVLTFLIANVCVTLFPTGTWPYDTAEGVEVSEAAWIVPGARNMTARLNNSAEKEARCRRQGPPGWMLFERACWENPQKRFWEAKNLVL